MNIIKSTSFRAVALSSLISVLAAAQTPAVEPRSETVSFRDLNLGTIEGATALYQRIKVAARSVCGGNDGLRLDQWASYDVCYRQAIAQAVATVNSPLLTAVHSGKKPETVTAMLNK